MHLGSPHTQPLNWNLGWEQGKPFSPLQHIIPSVTALGQRMVVPPTFAGLESVSQLNIPSPFPTSPYPLDNLLERYLQQPPQSQGYPEGYPAFAPAGGPFNYDPGIQNDPGTMFPVNQLPNQATGISPRLSDREPILEGNNPVTDFGFPTRYIYPDKTTGTVPRPSGITGLRPRPTQPILENNNPIINTGLPTGTLGPLPPRPAPFQGALMEGNNPTIPPPTPTQVGFAAYMRRIGMPLPNDPVANAPLGLGLGFR